MLSGTSLFLWRSRECLGWPGVSSAREGGILRSGMWTPTESCISHIFLKQFDYGAVANKLFKLASRQSTPSRNRKRLYKVIQK